MATRTGSYEIQLRRPLDKSRCSPVDTYLSIPWREHEKQGLSVHVDHVLELQLVANALRHHIHGRALARNEALIAALNAPPNLNVTRADLNLHKGSVFRQVARDVLLAKEIQPIERYVLQSERRVTRSTLPVTVGIARTICTLWEDRVESTIFEIDEKLAEQLSNVMDGLIYHDGSESP